MFGFGSLAQSALVKWSVSQHLFLKSGWGNPHVLDSIIELLTGTRLTSIFNESFSGEGEFSSRIKMSRSQSGLSFSFPRHHNRPVEVVGESQLFVEVVVGVGRGVFFEIKGNRS